jgi:DNA (cytosine-5)-methyltransferase 1
MIRKPIMTTQAQLRSSEEISRIMRQVHSRDTTPEIVFRKALWAVGLRYKLQAVELPGKPDILFPSKRVIVFVDGDYWHGGQWSHRDLTSLEEQFAKTKTKPYWLEKIRRNMSRDCAATAHLLSEGWTVLRFWESDIRKNLDRCVKITLEVVQNGVNPTSFSKLPQKTFVEFFAGIGLLRMALERHGWKVDYANDIDPRKREMYEAHFQDPEPKFHLGDIHHLRPQEIPSATLATASFPCNDLSLAGARSGLKGRESSAFWGFTELIKAMGHRRPPLILIENVTGFLTSHGGQDFYAALLSLNRLGYAVDTFVIDALMFVPQSRQRLFVIGIMDDCSDDRQSFDVRTVEDTNLRPRKLAEFILSHPDIRWKIRSLPSVTSREITLKDILEELPEDAPEWWTRERARYLLNQMSPRHRRIAEDMISGNTWSYGTVFRRIRNKKSMAELRTDGIAGCLRTPRGGSGRQILFKAGHGKYFARLLTPRECAKLQGADDYQMVVPLNQALFGFGDAVCVPVIEWIARYYLNPVVNELLRGHPLYPESSEI